MKKLTVVLLVISIFLLSGCNNTEKKEKKFKDLMIEYGTDYYERFGVKQMDIFYVTIEDLKKTNDKGLTDYDLNQLKDCENDTKVIFTIDKNNNGEILETEFELNCKK